jgi:GT2 family glycosyltransferase
MRVDVIVCTYDRAELLADTLESLLAQETRGACELEILVVDNDSRDATRAVVAAAARRARVAVRYFLETDHGVAHARNRGVREATAEWIAFLDDDELADPCWIRELTTLASAQRASCVSGANRLALPPGARDLSPFCRGLLGATPEQDAPLPLTGKQLPGTGNVLIHRGVFDRVGPFDPDLVVGAEDEDFFRRVRAAGYAIWFAPRATIVHRIPAYRLTPAYLTWTASRHGVHYARRDAREGGRARVVRQGLLRAVQAVGTAASLLAARAAGDEARRLEHRCRVARAVGYERQALRLVAPWFTQARYFEGLEFRAERARFDGESAAAS